MGSYAFSYCTFLAGVSIRSGLTSISSYMFNGCTSLANATMGSNVTSVVNQTFYNCTSLERIVIPTSVTSISIGTLTSDRALNTYSTEELNTLSTPVSLMGPCITIVKTNPQNLVITGIK